MRTRHAPVGSPYTYDSTATLPAPPTTTTTTINDLPKPTFQPGTYVYEQDPMGQLHKLRVGRLLGRGGFAKCYEVSDATGSYALKAINRAALDKPKTLAKLHSEIAIHRKMKHKNVVNFIRTFKDRYYVYILLEKCDNGCLMDLLKVRPLSYAETQFIMQQLVSAMVYLHENNIIHRDLKPGNVMLDENIHVKVGDFGLAAELQYDGERKRTVCGTPNYIAPEIIDKQSQGHSFEVDVWSLGVILCALLTGLPPFQMEDVDATYRRIRQCKYELSATIPEPARDLIRLILQSSPQSRPTLIEIRQHPFFDNTPQYPPTSFTTFGIKVAERPRRATLAEGTAAAAAEAQPREVLRQLNANNAAAATKLSAPLRSPRMPPPPHNMVLTTGRRGTCPAPAVPAAPTEAPEAPLPSRSGRRPSAAAPQTEEEEDRQQLTMLHEQLHQTLLGEAGAAASAAAGGSAATEPSSYPTPPVWVTECADFSSKYGLCYKLNTGHTGAHFNDSTKMVWEPVTGRVEYYSRMKVRMPDEAGDAAVVYAKDKLETFTMADHPTTPEMEKKVTLIKYFKTYLGRSRSSAGKDKVEVVSCSRYTAPVPPRLSDTHVSEDFIYVKRWLSTPEAMVFRLSNKTVQVCFKDGAEVILSSEWKVVTYTDPSGSRRTLPLSAVASESEEAASRLRRTKSILYELIRDHQI